jgi:predicted DNA-binding transcriptional regulator YafY
MGALSARPVLTLQCMGGWCRSRSLCKHYHASRIVGIDPIERLCRLKEEPERIRRDETSDDDSKTSPL